MSAEWDDGKFDQGRDERNCMDAAWKEEEGEGSKLRRQKKGTVSVSSKAKKLCCELKYGLDIRRFPRKNSIQIVLRSIFLYN